MPDWKVADIRGGLLHNRCLFLLEMNSSGYLFIYLFLQSNGAEKRPWKISINETNILRCSDGPSTGFPFYILPVKACLFLISLVSHHPAPPPHEGWRCMGHVYWKKWLIQSHDNTVEWHEPSRAGRWGNARMEMSGRFLSLFFFLTRGQKPITWAIFGVSQRRWVISYHFTPVLWENAHSELAVVGRSAWRAGNEEDSEGEQERRRAYEHGQSFFFPLMGSHCIVAAGPTQQSSLWFFIFHIFLYVLQLKCRPGIC